MLIEAENIDSFYIRELVESILNNKEEINTWKKMKMEHWFPIRPPLRKTTSSIRQAEKLHPLPPELLWI